MELLSKRPKTEKFEKRLLTAKPNNVTKRVISSNCLIYKNFRESSNLNNVINDNKFQKSNMNNTDNYSSKSNIYCKNSSNRLLQVKKSTLKLFRESKFSPFEKLADYDKFRLRLKSSENMKKNTKNQDFSYFNVDFQSYKLETNKNLRPFELEKENLDLLIPNHANKIKYFHQERKCKTSQKKTREDTLNLKQKIYTQNDILFQYDNFLQQQIHLTKSNLTSATSDLKRKIKTLKNNHIMTIEEQKEEINYGENKIELDSHKKNSLVYKPVENHIDKKLHINIINSMKKIESETTIKNSNGGVELDLNSIKKYLFKSSFPPNIKSSKKKLNLMKKIEHKKFNYIQEDDYKEEIKDYVEEEKKKTDVYYELIRRKLNEIVLENFSQYYDKEENLINMRNIKFFDDDYKTPNMNSKFNYVMKLDSSDEFDYQLFIKEKIISPNSLKNQVIKKLNEKRIFLKNNMLKNEENISLHANERLNTSDFRDNPTRKFDKFKLSNFDLIGYLKNKYDNFNNVDFADIEIKKKINFHLKDLINTKKRRVNIFEK